MGFILPVQDVSGYSKSKPPLVVFLLCLMIFACGLLTVGFYFQYTETILNPEIKVTWKKFLSRLDSLHLCTYAKEQSSDEDILALSQFIDGGSYNSTSNDNTVSITVSALVLALELHKLPPGMVAVTGRIEMDDMVRESRIPTALNMTFVIPGNLTASRYKDTCVILTGPAWFMPFSRRFNVCVPSSINRTITHVGNIVRKKPNETATSCKYGTSLRLSYNNQMNDDFFLSRAEKLVVYRRVIHAVCFIFIISIALYCYYLLHGRFHLAVVRSNRIIG